MTPHFADLLADAIARRGSPACVGLDPVLESLPPEARARHHDPLPAIGEFCRGVLAAVGDHAPAVKFQAACFERSGGRGVTLLEERGEHARRLGLVVIYDAKRGDISTSAAHYAAAALRLHAHAVTLSGYMGASAVTPFLDAGLGVFVLVRTSNSDSDAIQSQRLADGRSVGEMMADHVAALGQERRGVGGLSDVGAVVGATKSADAAALRRRMPDQVFLVPGYGAQGGSAEDIRAMLRPGRPAERAGVLVTASRSVIYAAPTAGESWQGEIENAAKKLASELKAICAGK